MLRLKNPQVEWPQLYPKVERYEGSVTEKGWVKVDGVLLRDNIDLIPQLGLQEQVMISDCNLIFMAGAATMGKTYAGFMKALQGLGRIGYTGRLISKRLQDSKKGGSIIRDAKQMYDGFAGCEFTSGEYPTASWSQWNSTIQLTHANFNTDNPSEWEEYKDFAKKSQSGYCYWDELTEIKDFRVFSYMFSRNRDGSGVRPCTVASFNPEHEHWTTDFLRQAGYIGDNWYAIPEKYNTIKYFAIQGDSIKDIIFGDTKEEVAIKANIVPTKEEADYGMTAEDMIKSFTFLSGSAVTNKILANLTGGGSIANLYNVGETERKKLKEGYFGPGGKSELTVTTKMITNLWENPTDTSKELFATMDVASGGGHILEQSDGKEVKHDNCTMWIWRGLTAIDIQVFEGSLKELVPWIESTLAKWGIPVRNFAFDAVAIGYFLASFTEGIPIVGNSRPIPEYDTVGNQVLLGSYFNLRTQLMAKTAMLIATGQMSITVDRNKLLPHGHNKTPKTLFDIMQDEKNVFILDKKNTKDYYRSKTEYMDRFKSSPDYFDPYIYRARFELDARPRKEEDVVYTAFDYAGLYNGGW